MPNVQGSDPRGPQKRAGGSWIGWIVPLLIFGPTIYRGIRNMVAGRLTDQQLLIAGAGLVLLVALVVVVQRIQRSRNSSASSLPTAYQPPKSVVAAPVVAPVPSSDDKATWSSSTDGYARRELSSDTYVTRAPQFEPIFTGKVVLAGIVLAAVLSAIGLLLLQAF